MFTVSILVLFWLFCIVFLFFFVFVFCFRLLCIIKLRTNKFVYYLFGLLGFFVYV